MKASANPFPHITLTDTVDPTAPASGTHLLFVDTDEKLKMIDHASLVTDFTPGAGGSVATDAIWDAAGDLAVGSGANTAGRLAAGADSSVLAISASTHIPVWAAAPASGSYTRTAGNYTSTSQTFEDVDATNMKVTITTLARRCLVTFSGMAYPTAAGSHHLYWDVDLDGTRLGNQGNGIVSYVGVNNDWAAVSFSWVTEVLTAASHTFKLQWRMSPSAVGANLYGAGSAWPARFSVVELS